MWAWVLRVCEAWNLLTRGKKYPFTVFSLFCETEGSKLCRFFFLISALFVSRLHILLYYCAKKNKNIRTLCVEGVLSIRAHDMSLVTIVVQWRPGRKDREMRRALTWMKNLLAGRAWSVILPMAKTSLPVEGRQWKNGVKLSATWRVTCCGNYLVWWM